MTHIISLRVSLLIWQDPERWTELLGLLEEYQDTITEVAFFTSATHPPLPLQTIQNYARKLKEDIIPQAKALGLSAGINHLSTLGHLDENLENSLREDWQHLVDIDGTVSASCYCAADPRVMEYIRQCYIALASAGPDFLWVDDDIRMEAHQPAIKLGCFCPTCLEQHSRESGRSWTRHELYEALNSGPREERFKIRRQWQAHIQAYIARLLSGIRSAVDEVDPSIVLGGMTGEIAYSSYGYAEWARALAGPRGLEVKWRPGGGFYTDDRPLEFFFKAHSAGRQAGSLPAFVQDIQWEHENFPYQPLRKSRTIFQAEMAAALGAGCTGVALNIMGVNPDPLEEYVPLFRAIRDRTEFMAQISQTFGRSACEGVWPAFTPFHFSALQPDGPWETAQSWGLNFARFEELYQIGLPPAYSQKGAKLVVLSAEACDSFSREDLMGFLSQGVLMDGAALGRLQALGLDEYVGFCIRDRKDRDTIERLTSDPLNGRFAGWSRDCRPSFYPEPGFLIEPMSQQARPLSELVDFNRSSLGVTSGVFENSQGGRIAVMGYYPYTMIQSLAKSTQMRTICRWLSRDTIPGYIASYHKAELWCRRDPSGRTCALALNASADTVDHIMVCVRSGGLPLMYLKVDGFTSIIPPSETVSGYSTYELDRLEPWEPGLLTLFP